MSNQLQTFFGKLFENDRFMQKNCTEVAKYISTGQSSESIRNK